MTLRQFCECFRLQCAWPLWTNTHCAMSPCSRLVEPMMLSVCEVLSSCLQQGSFEDQPPFRLLWRVREPPRLPESRKQARPGPSLCWTRRTLPLSACVRKNSSAARTFVSADWSGWTRSCPLLPSQNIKRKILLSRISLACMGCSHGTDWTNLQSGFFYLLSLTTFLIINQRTKFETSSLPAFLLG